MATEEARSRAHESVSSEHLLMGILRDGEGLGVRVLERLQVNLESLRIEVERALNDIPASATNAEPSFGGELKNVLAAAVEEQRRHRHSYIGTEHLMLGLLSSRSPMSGVMRRAGADLDEARSMTVLCIGQDLRPLSTEQIVRAIATSKWHIQM
jgi:ATP-dependent Clp protease ATP-binding subunit ClpC